MEDIMEENKDKKPSKIETLNDLIKTFILDFFSALKIQVRINISRTFFNRILSAYTLKSLSKIKLTIISFL